MISDIKGAILVVDDSHDNLAIVNQLLSEVGHTVYPADSGEFALSAIANKLPDLILLDVRMPGMDGFEVCRRIKSNPEWEQIPIVFLTANSEIDSKIEGLRLGAVDFIVKPFHKEELLVRVNNHLKTVMLTRQLNEQAIEIAEKRMIQKKNEELKVKNEEIATLNEEYLTTNECLLERNKELSDSNEKNNEIEDKLRFIFEHTVQGIISHNATGKISYANKAAEEILGLNLENFQGKTVNDPIWQTIHEDGSEYPGNMHPVSVTFRTGQSVMNARMGVYNPNSKSYRWININSIPRFKPNQTSIHEVIATFEDVTEVKNKTDELLRIKNLAEESERKYKMLFDSAGTANSIFDKECRLVLQNEFSKTELGNKDAIGMTVFEIFGQTQGAAIYERMTRVFSTGIAEVFETQFNLLGEKKWFRSAYQPIRNENKEVMAIQLVSQDITEQRKIEELLIESEEKYKLAFQTSPDAIAITKLNGVYIDINQGFMSMTGYNRDEVVGKSSLELNIWANPEDRLKMLDELRLNKKIENFETVFRIKDGSTFIAFMSINVLKLNNEPHILSITRNISERKNIENQLVAAKELAEKNEERYRFLAENIKDVIWVMDVESMRFTYVSPSVEKLRGYTVDEVMAQTAMETLTMESQEYLATVIPERIKGRLSASYEDQYFIDEIAQPCKDGSIVWTEVNSYYQITPENKIEIIGTSRNINERKKADLALKLAKEKAEESDRLKTAFLQNMSHEIRTPMNAIMGFSDLLVDNYNNKPKLEQYSRIITQRSNDLLEIINEILDIAKIESGQFALHFDKCNLKLMFDELLMIFNELRKHQNKMHVDFVINTHFDPLGCEIESDTVKLKQVFINLIGNSFKFTSRGKVETGCFLDENNKMVFFVSDTGIGIPKEKQEIIFDRFIQASHDTSMIYGGTGLGLSISKGIISLMGGRIWVESEEGLGTTFFFSFPYKYASNQITSSCDNSTDDGQVKCVGTVLVVEDDLYNGEYLKEVLSNSDLNVLFTKSGLESIDIVLTQHVDIVLMDIRLPDITGFEATRKIKQQKPSVKIIAQTAYATPDDRKKALDAGCDEYISKPIRRDKLNAMITSFLNN